MTRLSRRSRLDATLPCPRCGTMHDYDCRRYVFITIGAALATAASLLTLIAALPAVIR